MSRCGDAIAHLLELGYGVTAVSEGDAALLAHRQAQAEGLPFVLAVLDLTIPGGMGGRELMARLRETDQAIAAIASSGYAGDPVLSEPKEYGFDAQLAKPYRRQELVAALEAALAQRRH